MSGLSWGQSHGALRVPGGGYWAFPGCTFCPSSRNLSGLSGPGCPVDGTARRDAEGTGRGVSPPAALDPWRRIASSLVSPWHLLRRARPGGLWHEATGRLSRAHWPRPTTPRGMKRLPRPRGAGGSRRSHGVPWAHDAPAPGLAVCQEMARLARLVPAWIDVRRPLCPSGRLGDDRTTPDRSAAPLDSALPAAVPMVLCGLNLTWVSPAAQSCPCGAGTTAAAWEEGQDARVHLL